MEPYGTTSFVALHRRTKVEVVAGFLLLPGKKWEISQLFLAKSGKSSNL
jgi:hypothetical protein